MCQKVSRTPTEKSTFGDILLHAYRHSRGRHTEHYSRGGAAAMRPIATLNIALVSVIVVAVIIVTVMHILQVY